MRIIVYVVGIFFSLSQLTFSQECSFIPEKPRPDWISGNPNLDGFYVGVGLANQASDPQQQIETARRAALKDLSNTITVSIQQDMVINESLSQEQASQDVKSLTRIFSNTTLRDVNTDDTWLDRDNCIVWIRVKVSEDVVKEYRQKDKQQEKLTTLLKHLDVARNEELNIERRVENNNLAKLLLEEINFTVLDDARGEDYYRNLVSNVDKLVTSKQQQKETASNLFTQARQLLEKASITSSSTEKSRLTREAKTKLNRVLSEFRFNQKDDWSEQASLRLGEIARNTGNDCEAKKYFEQLNNNTQFPDWKSKASVLLIGLSCSKNKLKEFKWREQFDGVKVLLTCAYQAGKEVMYWEDLCDRVRTKITAYGAIVEEEDLSDGELKNIVKRRHKSRVLKKFNQYEKQMIFVAKGTLGQRKNKKNPMGIDYQFKGKISTSMTTANKLEFSDKYSGAGGWNPVSGDMAMEVLGVHVEKRWFKKFESSFK